MMNGLKLEKVAEERFGVISSPANKRLKPTATSLDFICGEARGGLILALDVFPLLMV